jgi:heavy metal efflux system protein
MYRALPIDTVRPSTRPVTRWFGDDFRTLDALGEQVLRATASVHGAADAQMLITSGVAELSVRVDRAALARYGLNVTDVEDAVAAAG